MQQPATASGAQAAPCPEWLEHLTWDTWLEFAPLHRDGAWQTHGVTHRFSRNGYEWDIHGTLYEPEVDRYPGYGFFLTHGGAGSEDELRETPDGRPGLAAVLAAQGFRCLAVTWPGHYPPGGEWEIPAAQRNPVYLLDRALPQAEIDARNLRCTFNTIVQGAAGLVDRCLSGRRVFSFGHSTGGPMAVFLHRFLRESAVAGLFGWGSGGPDGWYREWVQWFAAEHDPIFALDTLSRRTAASFRAAGYEDPADLCPWGDAEGYTAWADRFKSQMKTGLCDNQHFAHAEQLRAYAQETGLPEHEYLDHLHDPDPAWLSRISVLLLTGENDRHHWLRSCGTDGQLERFIGEKYAQRAARTRVMVVPRYGHFGYVSLHNEKIVYCFLRALHDGFFGAFDDLPGVASPEPHATATAVS
jgi:hypothetical protein